MLTQTNLTQNEMLSKTVLVIWSIRGLQNQNYIHAVDVSEIFSNRKGTCKKAKLTAIKSRLLEKVSPKNLWFNQQNGIAAACALLKKYLEQHQNKWSHDKMRLAGRTTFSSLGM